MVTNAVNDILGVNPMGVMYKAGGAYNDSLTWNDELLPICPNMIGGILEKLCSIIEKWNLTQYDAKDSSGDEVLRWYRVCKSWADSKTQKGAYKILDNAKKCADQNL